MPLFGQQYAPNRRTWFQPVAASGGGFQPSQISGMWLGYQSGISNFSDAGTVSAVDGLGVRQITDLSSSAHPATQPNILQRPIFLANGFAAGKSALAFDGTAMNLYFDVDAHSQPFTVFLSGRYTNAGNSMVIFFDSSSRRIDIGVGAFFGGSAIGLVPESVNCSVCFVVNGASSKCYTNGVLAASGDVGANTVLANTTGSSLMSRRSGDANWTAGFLSGVYIYDGVVSDPNRVLMDTYLLGKMQ